MLALRITNGRAYITGYTYPIRDELRQRGLIWEPTAKAWWTKDSALAYKVMNDLNSVSARALAAARDAKPAAKPAASTAPRKRCWECGCAFTYGDAKRNDGDWSDSYCGC